MRLPPAGTGCCWYWAANSAEPIERLSSSNTDSWFSFRMQQLTDFAVMEPFRSERHDLLNFGNCRQVQLGPTALLKKMSDEIIDV